MRFLLLAAALLLMPRQVFAEESEPAEGPAEEESARPLVVGGIYDKPYLYSSKQLRLGGYIDAQANYLRADGFVEDAGFKLERLNLFTFSAISSRVRVISELEIEDGGETLVVELGVIDIELGTEATLRAGMILIPIGRFNISHDSPANLMVDRPLTSQALIPGTLSEPGLGVYGAVYLGESRLSYELYAVNGLGTGIANNSTEGTRFGDGKPNLEDENHHPSLTGRLAYSPIAEFEVAASGYAGPWNVWKNTDGQLDKKRWLGIMAVDAVISYPWGYFAAEFVQNLIDLPPGLPEDVFAQYQRGLFVEGAVPLLRGMGLQWPRAELRTTMRYEFVDRNAQRPGDDTHRLALGLNWLPSADTVIKFNYRRSRIRDANLNPSDEAALQLGFASYF